MATAQKRQYFDNGTQASSITAANSGASGDAFDSVTVAGAATGAYQTSATKRGAKGARIVGGASDVFTMFYTGSAASSGSLQVFFRFNSVPTVIGEFVGLRSTAGNVARFSIHTNGRLLLQDAVGSLLKTFNNNTALTTGAWYRVDLQATKGTATSNGMIAGQLYSASDVLIDSYMSSTVNAGTEDITVARLGKVLAASDNFNMDFDDFGFSTGTTDPINSPSVAEGTVGSLRHAISGTWQVGEIAYAVSGSWSVSEEEPPTGNPRDDLVYGGYKPTYSHVGILPGSTLTAYNNTSVNQFTLPTGGGVIENKIIYGDIRPNSDGGYWQFKNCRLVGGNHIPSTGSGIVQAYDQRSASSWTSANWSTSGRLHFIDCEFKPRRPSLNRDGIVGHGYTLERCLFTGGLVDCCGSFIDVAKGSYVNNRILGCILEETAYGYPDYKNGVSGTTAHNDGTHNDLIQHQGGDNLEVIGNWLNGTSYGYIPGSDTYPDYPWMVGRWNTGACILIQRNIGTDTTLASCKVKNNWMNGGKFQLVIDSNQDVEVSGNIHSADVARRGSNSALGGNYNGVHIWVKNRLSSNVPGVMTTMTSKSESGLNLVQVDDTTATNQGWITADNPNTRIWRTPSWPTGMTDASS